MDYLTVKWLHILSATILFGTGLGSAFFLCMANLRKDIQNIYFVVRHVVIADWIFTTPSIFFQFFSGLYLVHLEGLKLSDGWIAASIALYLAAGLFWVPVMWMQIQMRDMAKRATQSNGSLPERYWQYSRWWTILGSLAFPAVVIVFWLMVTKPTLTH